MAPIEIINPFVDSITIPDRFFCDRESETRQLIENITANVKTVLYAPRRVGKSSLIQHVLGQKEISENFNSLYVDILGTRDSVGFADELQKALLRADFARDEKIKQSLLNSFPAILTTMAGLFISQDSPVNMSTYATSAISMSLGQIFEYLESTKKPTIVVFDEFQKIEEYPEPMAAILRGEIQKLRRTRFIFSGSETHMLSIMFNNRNKPFFSSARDMSIGIISLEKYTEYCKRMFEMYGKGITDEAVSLTYYTFCGITRSNQEIMRYVFQHTQEGTVADRKDIIIAIKDLVISKENSIRTELGKLPATAHLLFRHIAANGILENPTSTKQQIKLTQSQIQHLANKYSAEEIALLTKVGKNSLKITDKLMELFILGPERLEERLQCSKAIFEREQQLSSVFPEW